MPIMPKPQDKKAEEEKKKKAEAEAKKKAEEEEKKKAEEAAAQAALQAAQEAERAAQLEVENAERLRAAEEEELARQEVEKEISRSIRGSDEGESANGESRIGAEGDGNGGTSEQSAPQAPPEPAKPIQEQIEDLLQRMLAICAIPSPHANAMASVSTQTLLQMLGSEAGPFIAKAPRRKDHSSFSTMTLIQRLNEEFRVRQSFVQDQYLDKVASMKTEHANKMQEEQQRIAQELDRIRAEYQTKVRCGPNSATVSGSGTPTGKLTPQPQSPTKGGKNASMSGIPTIPPMDPESLSTEIGRLERKIFDREAKKESGASVSSKRLITFWKTKYEALCAQFEQQQEKHFTVRTKLEEAQALMNQNSKQLQSIVDVLRTKEQKERHREEALKAAYVKEMNKRSKVPEEPRISISQITGCQLSHSKLMAVAQYGWESLEASAAENAEEAAAADRSKSTGSNGQGHPSSNRRKSASSEQVTFTKTGAKSPSLMKACQEMIDQRDECRLLEAAIREDDKTLAALREELEQLQQEYARAVGQVTGPVASLLEEVILLQGQVDANEASTYDAAAEHCQKKGQLLVQLAETVETLERTKALAREREENLKRTMREKEIDMVRIRGKLEQGQTVSASDFSDAPVKDPQLKLDVLRARLSVLDCERQLLRSRLKDATNAEVDVMNTLEARLKVPNAPKATDSKPSSPKSR